MRVFLALVAIVLLSSCGMVKYPGQPGVVTHNYSKIDLEYLEGDGLYVYEVVYDNRPSGDGVGAIITKLYPNAQTYTSNVRTNADGTLYRAKGAYEGAEVQMIAVPKLNQVYIPPTSHVQFFLEQALSLDEVDDVNTAEVNLFKPGAFGFLSEAALEFRKFRWDLLRAGRLTRAGTLSYEVSSIELAGQKFTPSSPVHVETSFTQNSLHTNLTQAIRAEAAKFLETSFPKGYQGVVNLYVKGASAPLSFRTGIHSIRTAEAAGYKIIHNVSATLEAEIAARFSANSHH